jgi:hypothetical protein
VRSLANVQQQFAAHAAAIGAGPGAAGALAQLRRLAAQPAAHSRRLAQQGGGGDAGDGAPGPAELLLLYSRARSFAWKSRRMLEGDGAAGGRGKGGL